MLCSKCGTAEARNYHRWCRACHAGYMVDWRKAREAKAVRTARREGGETMKLKIIGLFERLEYRELNGVTAAEIVRCEA